jgi:hypothetical protein
MDVTLPDGTIIRNVPEGTTQAELTSRLRAAGYDVGRIQAVQQAQMDTSPTSGMSGFDLGVAGFGKAFSDIGLGARQRAGFASFDEAKETRERDKPLMDTWQGKAGNIAGNVAAVLPATVLPFANTILGGAAVGGALGALQPSESSTETTGNVTSGAAFGMAFPALSALFRTAKSAVEPFYESGKNLIVGRALRGAAGTQADDVVARLTEASKPFVGPQQPDWVRSTMGELVPGSSPTVAEVARSPGISALQRAAVATNPEVTNAVALRQIGNSEARRGALSMMAGEDGARDMAKAALDATGDLVYQRAFRSGVPQLTPDQVANVAKFMERVPASAIERAKTLAKIKGIALDDTTSLQGMHWVKMALDDQISAATRSGDNTLARALTGLQKDLLNGIDKLSPEYAAARAVYKDLAKPVNEFDTIGAILSKSTPNKLTQSVQPRAFANALTDKTAQQATGFNKATLDSVVSNTNMNRLNAILDDLRGVEFAQNAGRGAGSDTVQKLAYTNLLDQAGVPSFLRDLSVAQIPGNLLSRGADVAYARQNRELAERLAQVMLDPEMAAEFMRRATPKQRQAMQSLLGGRLGLLGQPISDVPYSGLLAAPITANALQQ